ncbi:hypothetical protein ACLOJK_014759 [Asimina triloba]
MWYYDFGAGKGTWALFRRHHDKRRKTRSLMTKTMSFPQMTPNDDALKRGEFIEGLNEQETEDFLRGKEILFKERGTVTGLLRDAFISALLEEACALEFLDSLIGAGDDPYLRDADSDLYSRQGIEEWATLVEVSQEKNKVDDVKTCEKVMGEDRSGLKEVRTEEVEETIKRKSAR